MARRDERGAGGMKIIVILLVVVLGVKMALTLIPITADDKAMVAKVDEILKYARVDSPQEGPKDLQFKIWKKAQELHLDSASGTVKPPLKVEDIVVEELPTEWHCKISYHREANAIVYTYKNDVVIDRRSAKK